MINITSTFKYKEAFNGIEQQVNATVDKTIEQINQIGEETLEVMKQKISSSIKRSGSTGNLLNAMTMEKYPDGCAIGIIDVLNENTKDQETGKPYWLQINYGGFVPPTSKGRFSQDPERPMSGSYGARWLAGKGNYWIKPKKAVEGFNFIEAGITYLKSKLGI